MFNRCISNTFFVPTIETKVLRIDEAFNNFGRLCNLLKSGAVIAVPSDTVYSITCLASNKKSLKKIKNIKGQDTKKPLVICLPNINEVKKWAHVNVNDNCLNTLFPKPVTLIFNKRIGFENEFNPECGTIGVRIPNYKFLSELMKYCDEPLALTSANRLNEPCSLHIQEFESFWNDLDLIVDGGLLGQQDEDESFKDENFKAGSTVIDVTVAGTYKVVKEGSYYNQIIKLLEKNCRLIRRKV